MHLHPILSRSHRTVLYVISFGIGPAILDTHVRARLPVFPLTNIPCLERRQVSFAISPSNINILPSLPDPKHYRAFAYCALRNLVAQ